MTQQSNDKKEAHMQTTLTCTNCDEAFTVDYSPYSQKKPINCPSCGQLLDLPKNNEQTPQVATPDEAINASLSKTAWFVDNRYLICGIICVLTGLAFTAWSVLAFTIYIPFLFLALIFGVLDIADRKPFRGLGLIFFTVFIGALVYGYSMEREFGESSRQMNREVKQLENLIKQNFDKISELMNL